MPKLSIIIATYNSEKSLGKALESVMTQTFQDWECVIVDGASKDNTLQIIEEYEKRDVRFRHVSEPDNGIYDAFNKGWRLAKGEWIHYLGSDDRIVEDGFARLFSQEVDADLVGGGVYLVRDGEKNKLQFTYRADGCHQAFVAKREVIEKLGGFDETYKIIADKDLLVRIVTSGYVVLNCEIPIAYFYVGGVSQKLSSLIKVNKERYKIYKSHHYKKNPLLKCCWIVVLAVMGTVKHKLLKFINQ